MRISDWSSDVCSSDLTPAHAPSKGEVVMAPSHDPHTPVPPRAGVGLKAEHYREIVETGPDIGFFEVHAENYMGAGGPPHRYLTTIRDRYPLSLHGVGLSIGEIGRAHV